MENLKVVLITQARIGSTRLPKKVLHKIKNKTLLEIHIERIKRSRLINNIYIATTFESETEKIINIAKKCEVNYFQGSTDDVLDRFYNCSLIEKPDYIVRVTSDCPLIDHELIDEIINIGTTNNLDYYSNILLETFPDGQDVELISFKALEYAWLNSEKKSDREHVTPYIKRNCSFYQQSLFKGDNFICKENYSHIRMTVDEIIDLKTIEVLIDKFGYYESWKIYTDFINSNLNLFENQKINRNEGYEEV